MSDKRQEENEEEFKEKYGCRIGNFIEDAYSICREERQYAVFLYNILRYYQKPGREDKQAEKIFMACQIPKEAEVMQVFYEATFMRDFFERNRRIILGKNDANKLLNKTFSPSDYAISEPEKNSFNYRLIEYIRGDSAPINPTEYREEERNLGRNAMKTELLDSPDMIQWMMNVTPDIAVLYKKNEENYLLFLECKFESGEASYSDAMNQRKSQREIQWRIADFLCNHYLNENVKVSDCMKKEESSCLVRFVRSGETEKKAIKKKNKKGEVGMIAIRDLIDLNNRIFYNKTEIMQKISEEKTVLVDMAIERMIDFYKGNFHDISHFLNVYTLAKTIGIQEKLDDNAQQILELAAIVHDISCPLCREKYGNTNGKKQELESPPLVKAFLEELSVSEKFIQRISWIVAHHHTYTNVNGIEHQILLEADYLVNAGENHYSKEAIDSAKDHIFKTNTGKRILCSMFDCPTLPKGDAVR